MTVECINGDKLLQNNKKYSEMKKNNRQKILGMVKSKKDQKKH